VLRLLGTTLTSIIQKIYNGLYVNEASVHMVRIINLINSLISETHFYFQLKQHLGNQQVIYMPSHRSYADFILMSYICFTYDIEVPAIAAGMDFHGMMGMGELLRKTGAFFMRRTFSGEDLYWNLFREYVHSLITVNHTGLEFFVEGTRSRSCKALTPKTGLFSMALEPLFFGQVPDITIVPVSISYEKPLEEQLFVYELLGIPKPKESTMGLFKSLTNVTKQNFGSIYFEFGVPFSARDYFAGDLNRFQHVLEPAHIQQLTKDETKMINKLANEVVRRQQDKIVIMSFNLISLIINFKTFKNLKTSLEELKVEILELKTLFEKFGAIVALQENCVDQEIKNTLEIHSNIVQLRDGQLEIIKADVNLKNMNSTKLKGN
jgi:glycerone phosphate O-acyltransferase